MASLPLSAPSSSKALLSSSTGVTATRNSATSVGYSTRWRRTLPPTERDEDPSSSSSSSVLPSSYPYRADPTIMVTGVGEEAGSIIHAPSTFPLCCVEQFLAAKEETPAEFAAYCLYLSPSQVVGAPLMEEKDVLSKERGVRGEKEENVRSVIGTSGVREDPSGMGGSHPPMTDAELLSFLSSQRQHPSTRDAWKMPNPNASVSHPVIEKAEIEVVELSSVPEVRTGFLSTLFEDTSASTSRTTEKNDQKKRENGRKGDRSIHPNWRAETNMPNDFMETRANDADAEEEEVVPSASPPMVLFDTLQWDEENEDGYGANNGNGISFFPHIDGSASTPLAQAPKKSALGVHGEAEKVGMSEKVFIVPDIDDFLSCRTPSSLSPPVLPRCLPSSSFPENKGKPQSKVPDGSSTNHHCTKVKDLDRLPSAHREQKKGGHRMKRTPREKEEEKRAGTKKNATKKESKANPSRLSPPLRPSKREESPAEKPPSSRSSSSSSSLSRMSFGGGSLPGLEHFYDSPPKRIGKEGIHTSGRTTEDDTRSACHSVEGSDPAPSGVPSTLLSPQPNVEHAPIAEEVVGAVKEEEKDGKTMRSEIHRDPRPSFSAPSTGDGEGAAEASSPSPSPVYHFPDYRLGPAGAFSSITKDVLHSLYEVIEEITDDVIPFRADSEDTLEGEAKPKNQAQYSGLEAFHGDWKAYRLAPVVLGHEDKKLAA